MSARRARATKRAALLIPLATAVAGLAATGEASVVSPIPSSARALSGALVATARPAATRRVHAAEHFACNEGPKRPCYFSNPSDSVRCVWTPTPNNVTCELLATKRSYRLGPSGHAKAVRVKLTRRGETLPTNQMVVFPEKLSCQDTRTTMTCNQDEGFGEFKLALHRSHSA
jgi:hypothetical protein